MRARKRPVYLGRPEAHVLMILLVLASEQSAHHRTEGVVRSYLQHKYASDHQCIISGITMCGRVIFTHCHRRFEIR
ncbi:hypothetical protein K466DRAFT_256656 [Polyporus arcularius HHB13444]|uniref:Secreted protein n=1 Tax=Polyporus arcularius HHB13444 TaxID=1314778 RepID=A0A5C3PU35_9APHY|nr:hypothetical protein K466DRAFT_256656 [Polyporus arcularius HHB13444]